MTAPIEHRQLNAFVNGELDLKSQLEMESRLESDPALRRQVDEMRRLRELVRENADYHAAPDALRRRVAALTVRRSFGWRPLAASLSFAAVLAVAANLVWLQSSRDERLTDDVVASHVRATLGQHLVDVASSDHHTVKPFLSSKLGFSPPVNELRIPGSLFLGGRVDYLDGRPVAALVYKQGEHVVNSFMWPSTASESKPSFAVERGFLIAHWSRSGMSHWVISDVNREEFRTIVDAIAMADTAR